MVTVKAGVIHELVTTETWAITCGRHYEKVRFGEEKMMLS